ncbi:MAG: class I tRNA ligase family protein, partial [Actinomycetota bacterium]|nr:class I tRNA ligase family protein [Actinomycetota bacterium]
PLAPHLCEELWQRLGHGQSIAYEPFPQADAALLTQATVTCVVQVMGKIRDRIEVAPNISPEDLEALAIGSAKVVESLGGAQIRKIIVRAPKLVNIVAG